MDDGLVGRGGELEGSHRQHHQVVQRLSNNLALHNGPRTEINRIVIHPLPILWMHRQVTGGRQQVQEVQHPSTS
jgi:hypothetical protein